MIKTLLILWLSGYAIAHVDYEVGTLRILGKTGSATPWNLFISNGIIRADEKMSGFCPDDQGRVLSFALGKFMVIRDKRLVLTNSLKEIGVVKFSSDTERDSFLIHLDGNQVFQLCADYSISYNSTCHGATDIMFFLCANFVIYHSSCAPRPNHVKIRCDNSCKKQNVSRHVVVCV